ncbi:MAG: hypothetical protein C5B50_00375 [Verrucomicrobia bacterium]|nr:MAG: hypothetical protein C5B50_00375 [Verrucomicrobiota bacterium]
MKLRTWLAAIALGSFFVLLRWNLYNQPLVRDEGEYAYAGQLLKHGQLPYEKSFLQKPPMVAYSYALASLIAPKTFWLPRILAYACAAAATLLLGWIAKTEFGNGAQWPVMWLVTPMLLLPGRDQATANTEMFMILPLVGTVAIYVFARNPRGSPAIPGRLDGQATWFAAGGLAAVTFWYKYTALPLLLVLFGAWAWEEFKVQSSRFKVEATAPNSGEENKKTKSKASLKQPGAGRSVLYGFAGAAIASLVIIGWFLFRDGGLRLWECTVVFNRYYAQSESFDSAGFFSWLKKFGTQWWILLLLPLGLALKRRLNRLGFWLLMFVAAWIATAMSHYGHYYIVVMPFWALLAGVGIHRVAVWLAPLVEPLKRLDAAAEASHRAEATVLMREDLETQDSTDGKCGTSRWFCVGSTAVALLLMCWPDLRSICHAPRLIDFKALPPVLRGSEFVAHRVAELTSPQDYVLVAGSEPQILSYANRFSPTRFIIMYPLMIPTPVAYKYQREAMGEIENHRPALIVFTPESGSWLRHTNTPPDFFRYLDYLLGHEYEPVGGYLPNGDWKEPLSREQIATASLQVYRKK